MKTIQFEEKNEVLEYVIPESWSQVSIGMYQEFMSKDVDKMNEHELLFHLVSTFCKIPQQKIVKFKKGDIDEIYKHVSQLALTQPKESLNLILEIDGVEYGFNSKLDDISFGEFTDLDTFLNDGFENLEKVMAILYRPIVDKDKKKFRVEQYDFNQCEKRFDVFKNKMSIDSAFGCLSFFLNLGTEYTMISTHYLKKQNKKKKSKQPNNHLEQNGVGMQSFAS